MIMFISSFHNMSAIFRINWQIYEMPEDTEKFII